MNLDIRLSLRRLARGDLSRGTAVLSFAVCIAALLTTLAVLHGALYWTLPYDEPEALVRLFSMTSRGRRDPTPAVLELGRGGSGPIAAVACAAPRGFVVRVPHSTEVYALEVSEDFLRVSGLPIVRGGGFTAQDFDAGAGAPGVLVSRALYEQLRTQSSTESIVLSGVAHVVRGTFSDNFRFPETARASAEVIVPTRDRESFDDSGLACFGRLAPGATLESAQAWLGNSGRGGVSVESLSAGPGFSSAQWPTVGAVAGVVLLLLACLNIAGLLLAEHLGRLSELNTRLLLGANRFQVISPFLADAMVVLVLGGTAGLLLAAGLINVAASQLNDLIRFAAPPSLDIRTILFATLVVIVSVAIATLALLFSLHRLRSLRLTSSGGTQQMSAALGGASSRNVLAVFQVSLSFVLACAATVVATTAFQAGNIDAGLANRNVLVFDLPGPTGSTLPVGYREQVMHTLRNVPGVVAAAGVSATRPFRGGVSRWTISIPGRIEFTDRVMLRVRFVTDQFFRTMGIPVLAGREFNETDTKSATPAVILNHTAARQLWPDENPLGKTLLVGESREVVGVVGDAKLDHLEAENEAAVYIPLFQTASTPQTAVVLPEPGRNVVPELRKAIVEEFPVLPVKEIVTVSDEFARDLFPRQLASWSLMVASAIAITLCAAGLYATVAVSVSGRRREVAIRLALGQPERDVFRILAVRVLLITVFGLVIGWLGWTLLRPLLNAQTANFQIPDGRLEFVSAILVFIVAAGIGSLPIARLVLSRRLDISATLRS